jgi:hypothetical protein
VTESGAVTASRGIATLTGPHGKREITRHDKRPHRPPNRRRPIRTSTPAPSPGDWRRSSQCSATLGGMPRRRCGWSSSRCRSRSAVWVISGLTGSAWCSPTSEGPRCDRPSPASKWWDVPLVKEHCLASGSWPSVRAPQTWGSSSAGVPGESPVEGFVGSVGGEDLAVVLDVAGEFEHSAMSWR